MPRMAATLASLVLAASAIGVNVTQYPIVWQMVNGPDRLNSQAVAAHGAPAAAVQPAAPNAADRAKDAAQKTASTEPAPPHKPPPAAEKPALAQAKAPARSAAAAEAKPAAKPAGNRGGSGVSPVPTASTGGCPGPPKSGPGERLVGLRPLVPVVTAGLSSQSQAPPGADYEVRRLPPVDPAAFAAPSAPSAGMAGGGPAYPCTRTP